MSFVLQNTPHLAKLRRNAGIRSLLTETRLHAHNFVMPLFIHAGITGKNAIKALPGQYQLGLNCLDEEINTLSSLGIRAVLLFGIPDHKDETGSSSLRDDGIVQLAIRKIKTINPEMLVIADCCLCEYTTHGHCGIMCGETLDHEKTLPIISAQAVSLAAAGADWIAPSGMIDGMIKALRSNLDAYNFQHISLLSYAVKYSSALYRPFREATLGTPLFGDRQSHQLNPANIREALRETRRDVEEGADLLMVKPAGWYLDVITKVKHTFSELPLVAYQVGGEYCMIKMAAQAGFLDEESTMYESLLAIKRAGADLIISLFAKDIAKLL